MKTMKMALLAGAAVAVSAAAAHADELSDLKAQVEALNSRVAAMETAPSVPAGYQLLAISKGDALQVPGMLGSDRDRVTSDRATVISVMPTADAPAGTTISWSGYVRAAVIYSGASGDGTLKRSYNDGTGYAVYSKLKASADSYDDWDVKARGQLRVVATTDTAVGEVGVELKLRADFNGNGTSDVYMKTAWGYWAMTPELTLGGGYAGSLGNIGYGYDGACTCYYTDNADLAFDPGDTTQMRLSYASGPFSMAVAIEDASLDGDNATAAATSALPARSSTRATRSRAKSRVCTARSTRATTTSRARRRAASRASRVTTPTTPTSTPCGRSALAWASTSATSPASRWLPLSVKARRRKSTARVTSPPRSL